MEEERQDIYEVVAEFYDYVTVYSERQDVDFFVDLAQESKGPVLEVGCGTGRVLIPTARAGIEIVGIDNSLSMLAVCSNKIAHAPQEVQARIRLIKADMRSFDLGRKFPLITIPFRPFQHLTEVADQLSCLQSIRRHLSKDGKFVLDLFNPDMERLVEQMKQTEEVVTEEIAFEMPDGRKVNRIIKIISINPLDQILELEQIFDVTYNDGHNERRSQQLCMRYFFRYEVEHLLALSGFRIVKAYAGYDRSALGSVYPGELIYIATNAEDSHAS
jgi:ubiquinone/menaquinone biosynthesis C-methylase UbiE